MTPQLAVPALTRDQILGFYNDGFIAPLTIADPAAMAEIAARIDREVLPTPGPSGKNHLCRHLDHAFLRELATTPALVHAFSQLFGPDIMLWSTNFWIKNPGDAMTCWHQDIGYWPMNPPLNFSAWIAIERTTVDNSCLQVIPGSHRHTFPTRTIKGVLSEEAILDGVKLPPPVALELEAGQCVLFNERLLHHAAANTGTKRRIGMAVRVTPPFVKVDPNQPPLWPDHRCLMVSGIDRFQVNQMVDAVG